MKRHLSLWLLLCWSLCLLTAPARAATALPAAADPALEARMMDIASELRCVVCQNQTVADSQAGLAIDLRQQIREQLQAGRNEREIRQFMTDRYGDFVLYRPPFTAATALLWLGPALLLVSSLLGLALVLRRRSQLPAEAFEADNSDDSSDPTAPTALPNARHD